MKEAILVIGLVALVLFSSCLGANEERIEQIKQRVNVELRGWDELPAKNDGDDIEIEGYVGMFGGGCAAISIAVPPELRDYAFEMEFFCNNRGQSTNYAWVLLVLKDLTEGPEINCPDHKALIRGTVLRVGTLDYNYIEVSDWTCLELTDPLENCWGCAEEYAVDIAEENVDDALAVCIAEAETFRDYPYAPDECFASIAAKAKDPNLCNYSTEYLGPESRDECISAVAIATEDPAVCGLILGEFIRDRCYYDLVLGGILDSSLCNKIQNPHTRFHCLNSIFYYCNQDSDCVLAIAIDTCCNCPAARAKTWVDGYDYLDHYWVVYEQGKDYPPLVDCTDIACAPCGAQPLGVECVGNTCGMKWSEEKYMQVGETFTISLGCNPSTGYTWEITKIDGDLVELAEEDYQSSCTEPLPGCGGTCFFTFEALKEGSTKIEMVYCHSWECEETTMASQIERIKVVIS